MKLVRLVGVWSVMVAGACSGGQDVPLGGVDGAVGGTDAEVADASTSADAGPAAWSVFSVLDTIMPRDIWGSSATDVWIVGRFGALLHWTGGPNWDTATPPDTSADLVSVWGSASDEVWAVGSLPGQVSTIIRYNGTTWTGDTSTADHELTGVWGLPSGDAWLVGHAFNFHRYLPPPDDDWQREQAFDVVYWPEDIWIDAAPNSDIWIGGNQGISRWSNADSSYVESFPVAADIIGVWGLDANNVWAVGTGGAIMRWNGSSWVPQASNTTSDLHAVWASAPNDAWAVGSGGTIVHWNGTTWQPVVSGTFTDLLSIWGSSGSDIWAVGSVDSGIILRYTPQ